MNWVACPQRALFDLTHWWWSYSTFFPTLSIRLILVLVISLGRSWLNPFNWNLFHDLNLRIWNLSIPAILSVLAVGFQNSLESDSLWLLMRVIFVLEAGSHFHCIQFVPGERLIYPPHVSFELDDYCIPFVIHLAPLRLILIFAGVIILHSPWTWEQQPAIPIGPRP